jgi:glycine betaine/proline transport system ATP-binding protein
MVEGQTKILCQNVWKIFGPNPTHVLETVADDMTKEKLLEETGHVIAVKDEFFEAEANKILMVMELSGSGSPILAMDEPFRATEYLPPASQVKCDNLQEMNRVRLHSVIELFSFIYHHKYFTRELHSRE